MTQNNVDEPFVEKKPQLLLYLVQLSFMYLLQSCLWPQGQRPGLVGAPGGLACHGLVSEAGHEAGDGHHQPQHRGRVVLGRGGG